MFRPLFLRISRGAVRPFSGRAVFFSANGHALSSLAALLLFLSGPGAPASLLPGAKGVSGPGLVLELRPPRSPDAPEWEGEGELASGADSYAFSLGPSDRLYLSRGGSGPERIVLPEGSGGYYAALDARECRAEGRESRILPPDARARVIALLAGGAPE